MAPRPGSATKCTNGDIHQLLVKLEMMNVPVPGTEGAGPQQTTSLRLPGHVQVNSSGSSYSEPTTPRSLESRIGLHDINGGLTNVAPTEIANCEAHTKGDTHNRDGGRVAAFDLSQLFR